MALYNKMRPRSLSEVKGQESVVRIMRDSVAKGKIPNAMLFTGTRGTGKTTTARIVARMVNCEHPTEEGEPCNECESCRQILEGTSLDVLELDAASNNGVDAIRGVIEQCGFKPYGKKRVVILDEVHMLSQGAFNALLKILEEPPKSVVFILCTTELQKIPPTILSRCRKVQFETISDREIVEKLKLANERYSVTADEDALYLIAKAAKGSMRDAESIYEPFMELEQHITSEIVRKELGMSSQERLFGLMDSLCEGKPHIATAVIDEVISKGESLIYLLEDFFHFILDVISVSMTGDVTDGVYGEKCAEYARIFTTERLLDISNAIRKAYEQKGGNLYLAIQGMVISLVTEQSLITVMSKEIEALKERVRNLEECRVPVRSAGFEQNSYPETDEDSCDEPEFMPPDDGSFYSLPEGEVSPFEECPEECDAFAAPVAAKEPEHSPMTDSEKEEIRKISEEMGFIVVEDEEEDGSSACSDEPTDTGEVVEEKEEEEDGGFFGEFARQFGF